jgi:hypothetical protein
MDRYKLKSNIHRRNSIQPSGTSQILSILSSNQATLDIQSIRDHLDYLENNQQLAAEDTADVINSHL